MGTKEQHYYRTILKLLLENKVMPVSDLANNLGVSEKTVRTKIDQLDDWLRSQKLGYIERKPGTGVRLYSDHKDELLNNNGSEGFQQQQLKGDSRENQVIGALLKLAIDEPVTLQVLADKFYVSVPTFTGLLKSVNEWFKKHGLLIKSIRGKGIQIIGEENSYRKALIDYMVYMMPDITEALCGSYFAGVDYEKIKIIVINMENTWRIQFAENSFRTAWLMVCLSVKRFGKELGSEFTSEEASLKQYSEYSFAKSIYQEIENDFGIKFPLSETLFLTTELLSARKMGSDGGSDIRTNPKYFDLHLQSFVKESVEVIMKILNIDLSEDQILYEGLIMHLRSAIFRMRYGQAYADDIVEFVKDEYRRVYLASWSISPLFEQYYGTQITENEIAYIALYIQSAIVRRTIPLKALLVTNEGRGSSQLISALIKKYVPEITSLKIISEHDFKGSMSTQYDVILTNVKLQCNQERVIQIKSMITAENAHAITEAIKQIRENKVKARFQFSGICHSLFRVNYMLVHPQVSDKDSLIKLMVGKLIEAGDVSPDYLDNVIERENATTTAIGDGIAIPHGKNNAVNESRVVTAVLEKPILWHDEYVDVVFLLALKMDSDLEKKRTQQFYKDFIRLTENKEYMNQVRKINGSLDLFQYFIR